MNLSGYSTRYITFASCPKLWQSGSSCYGGPAARNKTGGIRILNSQAGTAQVEHKFLASQIFPCTASCMTSCMTGLRKRQWSATAKRNDNRASSMEVHVHLFGGHGNAQIRLSPSEFFFTESTLLRFIAGFLEYIALLDPPLPRYHKRLSR